METIDRVNGFSPLPKYQCPVTGERFNFITSLSNISPGLIAYLYKLRWDIEKKFDEVKSKMSEKKAWATSDTAKTMQAQFICLAHNLMLIFDRCLEQNGIKNTKEDARRKARLEKSLKNVSDINRSKLPLFLTTPKQATQRSVKFVRWLRNHLYVNTSWREATNSLRKIYALFWIQILDTVALVLWGRRLKEQASNFKKTEMEAMLQGYPAIVATIEKETNRHE